MLNKELPQTRRAIVERELEPGSVRGPFTTSLLSGGVHSSMGSAEDESSRCLYLGRAFLCPDLSPRERYVSLGEDSRSVVAASKELEAWVKSALATSVMWFCFRIHVVRQRALGVDICTCSMGQ